MKHPDLCPKCNQKITLPKDRRFASISCTSRSTQLWIIAHDERSYFFDAGDPDLHQHYRGKFRAELAARYAANGWTAIESSHENSVYRRLVETRKFSLQNTPIIDLPDATVSFDFSDVSCQFPIPTAQQIEIENGLRTTTIEGLLASPNSELCFAIDINHCQFSLVPTEVDHRNPRAWPISFTPFSEYIVFVTRCFQHGLFVDPRHRIILVFGESLTSRFSQNFSGRVINRHGSE